jgi:NADH-quinone oxidoreductase subunit N
VVGLVGFTELGARATVFYLLAYGLATIGAFAVVTLVREQDASGVVLGEATRLAQWAGLGRKAPWLTAAFALFLLSMAGIPLTAGFLAKFGVFQAAIDAGAWPLAVLGVLASAVALFFYVRVIVLMVLTPPLDDATDGGSTAAPVAGSDGTHDATPSGAPTGATAGATTGVLTAARTAAARAAVVVVGSRGPAAVAIAVCAVGVLLLGILPGPVLDLAGEAAKFRP